MRDHFNEAELRFGDHRRRFSVIARAYNEGAAFRLALPKQHRMEKFTATRATTEFAFPSDAHVWAGKNNAEGPSRPEGGFVGSQEWQFLPSNFAGLNPQFKYGLPFLVETSGVYIAVTEADLLDWAGMWLQQKPGAASTLTAALAPPLPAKPWPARIQANRTAGAVSDAPPPEGPPVQNGLVVASTPHNSPWRTFLVGRRPADLLGTNMVLNLATPNRLGDISWVKPGMASSKYAQMGVAGLKIDFIDRDDQWAVNWYEDIVKVAAENHLMIDFHGAYKPIELERTYPNQITREGIQGNEYNKWSTRETPKHRATLPFTRALLGPADYTPNRGRRGIG